jgi:hypothetical protein
MVGKGNLSIFYGAETRKSENPQTKKGTPTDGVLQRQGRQLGKKGGNPSRVLREAGKISGSAREKRRS